jgi:hypothetical protein
MTDSALYDHRRWLGFIQPIGLVVSPPALVAAQAILNLSIAAEHRAFLTWVRDVPLPDGSTVPAITGWPGLFVDGFGWQPDDLQPSQLRRNCGCRCRIMTTCCARLMRCGRTRTCGCC